MKIFLIAMSLTLMVTTSWNALAGGTPSKKPPPPKQSEPTMQKLPPLKQMQKLAKKAAKNDANAKKQHEKLLDKRAKAMGKGKPVDDFNQELNELETKYPRLRVSEQPNAGEQSASTSASASNPVRRAPTTGHVHGPAPGGVNNQEIYSGAALIRSSPKINYDSADSPLDR